MANSLKGIRGCSFYPPETLCLGGYVLVRIFVTAGNHNVAIGGEAVSNVTTGAQNVAVGGGFARCK